ncbi:unnamed protein product [Prorocentrum cordatum]|uniref:ABC transporter family G domain-containing protein n=1 Tax=Prorocentrum cordatum TaxID=2364126 RepID=A0ABN9U9H3_9DINO|nr:unnamed protein product [Polarella glacialis]
MQAARALLRTSRSLWEVAFPAVAMNVCVVVESWACPPNDKQLLISGSLVFVLVFLLQLVPAQRVFGLEERKVAWREASVTSLSQVAFSFVGKDLASLAEIFFHAASFTLTFLPLAQTFASGAEVFSVAFALIYCVWGIIHIAAIVFTAQKATMCGVVLGFMAFLFSGAKPESFLLVESLGGLGKFLVLVTPTRWALSHWIFLHMSGRGSFWTSEFAASVLEKYMYDVGFSLKSMQCMRSPGTSSVLERLRAHDGFECSSLPLLLLGALFRFLAAACLLITTGSSRASGGELPLGVASEAGSRLLKACLAAFLVFGAVLNVLLLGGVA